MLGILSKLEMETVLRENRLGRIGCSGDHELLILPVTYCYNNEAVFCHSFEGHKLAIMRRNPAVCFEVEAIADHQNWKSVVAQGVFEELTDGPEIEAARLQLSELALKKKCSLSALPPNENAPQSPQPQGPSIYYKITLGRMTGRFEQTVAS